MHALIERRSKTRFPLELNVRYRALAKKVDLSGAGRTLNVSSAGLLVASVHELSPGTQLELTLEWPWLLDETTPLQLVTQARVVRRDHCSFAVALERYQFRTMKRGAVVRNESYAVA